MILDPSKQRAILRGVARFILDRTGDDISKPLRLLGYNSFVEACAEIGLVVSLKDDKLVLSMRTGDDLMFYCKLFALKEYIKLRVAFGIRMIEGGERNE